MSAQKLKPSGVLGGILGVAGFAVLAGVLVTAMVTPAIAVTSMTAQGTISIFENLPDSIKIGQPSQQNQIFAMRGGAPVQIATIYQQNRQVVGWDDVSPFLKQAAVDGEDHRFYDHGGVDLPSVARALVKNVTQASDGSSGSSTLDMQLVKNILVQKAFTTLKGKARDTAMAAANGYTIDRKLKEMKLAIGLDKTYTKQQILLGYLNIVGMGSTTYGVEAAALQYFSVHAKDVTLPQAASLIAIVQQPTSQNLLAPKYYPANKIRRDQILKDMYTAKDITLKQRDDAIATPIASYIKLSTPDNGCRTATDPSARAACDYIINVITAPVIGPNLGAAPIVASMGSTPAERIANWNNGGYKIYSTINLDLQDVAQKAIDVQAPPSETRFQLGATANTVEAGTGNILVMAQNKLFDDASSDANGMTSAYNLSVDSKYGGLNGFDTGSTYKIFDLANWLQTGHGLYDTVNGTGPQTYSMSSFSAPCDPGALSGPSFKILNDGNDSGYYMSAKTALTYSVNNAFMNMAEKQDLCSIRATAMSMGAHRADFKPLKVVPTSILGINEQAPLTLAGAAATIGSGGIYCAPIIIAKITSPEGKELAGQPQTCSQAISSDVAAGVANAMANSMAVGTSNTANPRDGSAIGGKTGTSSSFEQDWVISTTSKIGSSVWTGNINSALNSLKKYVNPITHQYYYSSSRFAIMKAVVVAANKVPALKGDKAFAAASSAITGGSTANVPNVVGQTVNQATSVLSGLQFQATVGGSEASALPAGRVTRTDPAAGSKVSPGGSVTLYTSDGSLATTMPNVVGMTRQVADAFLTNTAGFNLSSVTYKWIAGNSAAGQNNTTCLVQSSNPAAGATAAKTDPIVLTVYGKPDGSDPGSQCPR